MIIHEGCFICKVHIKLDSINFPSVFQQHSLLCFIKHLLDSGGSVRSAPADSSEVGPR